MAEIFDSCGFWEPWKLQLKLMSQSLSGMDWDDHIQQEDQDMWKSQLSRLVDFPTLSIPRICIPADKGSISGIRLICVTDAAINAGGAAVYAGRKLNNSTWSCALVASKSKLMKATVPRNELSAVILGTELVYLVAKSIGPKVEEIIFATDSTIALSWCCNPTKKLRLFVFSHVETIRRMIEWTTGNDSLPIYHVNGELNPADLLTKKHELTVRDLSTGSNWQAEYPWMKLNTVDMPLSPYQSLTITKDVEELIEEECFKEISPPPEPLTPEMEFPGLGVGVNGSVHYTAVPPMPGRMGVDLLIDPVRLGWYRSHSFLKSRREQELSGILDPDSALRQI